MNCSVPTCSRGVHLTAPCTRAEHFCFCQVPTPPDATGACLLQHMGVELDEQNRRVDAVGARAENTHDEIRSARSRSTGTHLAQDCLAASACRRCCDGMGLMWLVMLASFDNSCGQPWSL